MSQKKILKLSCNLKKHRGFGRSVLSLYVAREKKDRVSVTESDEPWQMKLSLPLNQLVGNNLRITSYRIGKKGHLLSGTGA